MSSRQQLMRMLKRLDLRDGNALLLKRGTELAKKEVIDYIIEFFEKNNIKVLIAVVDELDDVTRLDEQEMNKWGWYRLKKANTVVEVNSKHDKVR